MEYRIDRKPAADEERAGAALNACGFHHENRCLDTGRRRQ